MHDAYEEATNHRAMIQSVCAPTVELDAGEIDSLDI